MVLVNRCSLKTKRPKTNCGGCRVVGEAVKAASVYKEEDTVVPRGTLPELLAAVKAVGAKHGFESICYGHAGDGNLHVNILKRGVSEAAWEAELPVAIRSIFEKVSPWAAPSAGSTARWVQRPYMDLAFGSTGLHLQRAIKAQFDPKGLLNPARFGRWRSQNLKYVCGTIHTIMAENLLKGKKGIIFGALNDQSIAWKTAIQAHAQERVGIDQCTGGHAHGRNSRTRKGGGASGAGGRDECRGFDQPVRAGYGTFRRPSGFCVAPLG